MASAFAPVPAPVARRVAKICGALPETAAKEDAWGHSFSVRRRIFCHLLAPIDGSGVATPMVIVRADPDEREVLRSIGHPYFVPRSGTDRVGVVLGSWTDWAEIRELVTESYRILAPKKLAALLP